MKKIYKKPILFMETFSITQSVATGCGAVAGGNSLGKPTHWEKETCGWSYGNMIVWTEANTGCSVKWGKDDEYASLCYNNPDGGNNIFSS